MADESRRSWLRAVRDALSGEQHDYTTGNLNRAILLLAIPMVLEMAMESVFAICDVYFVSRLGDAAVATVGLTESMLTIIYALAIGFAMATTAMVARRIGEKNRDGAVRVGRQAIVIALGMGALLGIPGFFFAGDLLRAMGAEPEVLEVGTSFCAIMLGLNGVIMFLFINNAIFRGAGDAVVAMRALWVANGVNLVLDPCLIFGLGPFPEMGVTGAAVATTIGRGIGVLYQFWVLARGGSRIQFRVWLVRVDWTVLRELLRLSVGGVTQFLIATASWVALMRMVSPFGKEAVAGYTIAVRILIFTILPAWGLASAAATLVGQNLGAGKPERAERAVWRAAWFNVGFLGFVMVVFLTLAPVLVAFFTERPETLRHGIAGLRIFSVGYILYAWGMVLMQAFNGAGDTATPTRINFVAFWMVQVPTAWGLAHGLGMGTSGVFWAVPIGEFVLATLAIWIFRSGRWKDTRIASGETPEADREDDEGRPPADE